MSKLHIYKCMMNLDYNINEQRAHNEMPYNMVQYTQYY